MKYIVLSSAKSTLTSGCDMTQGILALPPIYCNAMAQEAIHCHMLQNL